jgi:hypothetical protein
MEFIPRYLLAGVGMTTKDASDGMPPLVQYWNAEAVEYEAVMLPAEP